MTQTTATKTVQVIARYEIKNRPGLVLYRVRSSDGTQEYCTRLFHGTAQACSCPATKPCYHMKQLEAREQERNQQPVLTPAALTPVHEVMAEAQREMEQFDMDSDPNAYDVLSATKLIAEMRKAVQSVPSFIERPQGIGCEYCGKNHSAANCPF